MKKRLAIKGHRTRGKEVIETLQMLGGEKTIFSGKDTFHIYSLNDYGEINSELYRDCSLTNLTYDVFTLEEFLEKFPFKINDRVINGGYSGSGIISEMVWDCNSCSVKYCVKFDDLGLIVWFNRHEINLIENELFREDNIGPLHELCENLCNNKLSTLMIDSEVCDDEVEIILNDYEIEIRDGKTYAVKKKPKYPKTFIEVLNFWHPDRQIEDDYQRYYKKDLIEKFQNLLYARDVYWKIAGEEMGLGKPWEPTMETVYCISRIDNVIKCSYRGGKSNILEFPTKEMRDAFYENFKDLIEKCKELL